MVISYKIMYNSKGKQGKFEHRPESGWWNKTSLFTEDEKCKKNSLLALTLDSQLLQKRIHI